MGLEEYGIVETMFLNLNKIFINNSMNYINNIRTKLEDTTCHSI